MATTQDLRNGAFILFNGELCQVTEFIHRTPGNLRAFVQVKMKNMRSGKMLDHRFRAGEAIDFVRIEFKELQYLYPDGEFFMLMDTETFEQIPVSKNMFGDATGFLKEGMTVKVGFQNDEAIMAEPPTFVELEVTYTEPGLRGDTATNTLKPAKVETGATVNVPLFVNTGEVIKIDTRDWSYVGKVKQ